MDLAVELGGFLAAHGVWCVSDGEVLIPLVGQESEGKGRNMHRFDNDRLEDGVAEAQAFLASNPEACDRAALVYDGYVNLASGRVDALLVVIRSYAPFSSTLTMAVPYRNTQSAGGFAVYRPKFIGWQGAGDPDYQAFGEAFFRGVGSHQKGSVVWNEALNESQ